ncbi:MAG: phospholipid carrier-dependent glycosyltransferase [Proteobacteria bacterium]|nr:phospholipid carrier-dependent glycosyltransferase [Pseudomonadota bacterium]
MANVGQGLRQRSFGWWPWLVLAAFWFITMPFRPLVDPDEGRYAEIPREMAATGDWVTPRLNGLKYFEKPPMQYWATAATYSVFGFSEWTARLWTVGLGFLCLPMVFGWTRRLYGESAGFAAMVALAVSPYFELIAHLNILDSGFAFFLSAAVFAFALGQSSTEGSSEERRWILLAWLAAALAVLTKGIVVGVLAGATLVTYSALERDMRPWRRLHLTLGLPLFLAVTVPWFVAVSARNPSFLQFFFVHEHFARFLTKVHKREEPWWYFLSILAIGALPWLLTMPRALRGAWLESKGDSSFKPLKFMLVFSTITLLFFSVSSSKLAPYILPMMPTLAAIIGASVAASSTFARTLARITGVLMPVMAVGLFIYTMRRYGYFPQSAIQYLVGALTVGVYGVWATWKREVPAAAAVWATAASAILGWQCLLSAFTELPERSSYKLVKTIKPLIGPDTELFTIGQYRETLSPYLGRTLTVVQFQGELEFGLTEEPSLGLTADAFLAHWNASTNAVAFIAPGILEDWRSHGMQAKVIGGDNQTLVVSRL